MLSVVVGHAYIPFASVLYKVIYSCHMPLFMIISGFFFQKKLRQSPPLTQILQKKSRQLLLPILVFGTIYYILNQDLTLPFSGQVYNYYGTLIRTLWFLKANFFAIFIVLLLNLAFKNKRIHILFYILFCFLFMLVPDYGHTAGDKFLFPCFIAGLFLEQHQTYIIPRYKAHRLLWFLLLSVLYGFLLVLMDNSRTIYGNSVFLFEDGADWKTVLFNDCFRVAIGIIGSLFFLAIFENLFYLLPNSIIYQPFVKIGQITLPFYCFHIFLHDLFLHFHPNDSLSLIEGHRILYIVIMTVITYSLSVLWEKKSSPTRAK